MNVGPPNDIRSVEEALRAAVAAVGDRVVEDRRRGWLGRGFEWRLSASCRLRYFRDSEGGSAELTVTTQGQENLRLHQRLKGEISAALRGRAAALQEGAPPSKKAQEARSE